MSIRSLVFDTLAADTQLNVLGIDADSLYPTFSPDSPASDQQRFMTLRWGGTEPPVGRDAVSRPILLTVAMYDREKDYAAIDLGLQRARAVLDGLVATYTAAGGYVCGVDWIGGTDDAYDEAYEAVFKTESYRIVASGV